VPRSEGEMGCGSGRWAKDARGSEADSLYAGEVRAGAQVPKTWNDGRAVGRMRIGGR